MFFKIVLYNKNTNIIFFINFNKFISMFRKYFFASNLTPLWANAVPTQVNYFIN